MTDMTAFEEQFNVEDGSIGYIPEPARHISIAHPHVRRGLQYPNGRARRSTASIENLLPKSELGVDPIECATVTSIDHAAKTTEPVDFDENDPTNYRFAKIGQGRRYEIHAKDRRVRRRIHKSLCHRRVPKLV